MIEFASASPRAERAMAGFLATHGGSKQAVDRLLEIVDHDDLTDKTARAVFWAGSEIRNDGGEVSVISLTERLRLANRLTDVGGEHGVDQLTAEAATIGSIKQLAADVRQLARFRRRARALTVLQSAVAEHDEEAWRQAEAELQDIEAPKVGGGYQAPEQLVEQLFASFDGADPVRWAWPLDRLNEVSGGGARRGQLTGIFGPSSHGKSAFLDCALLSMGASGANVLLALNEMTAVERAERIAANLAGVNYSTIQKASSGKLRLDPRERTRILDAMVEQPIGMVSAAGWNIDQIIREARRRQADVLAIDIIQKLPFQAGVKRLQVLEDAVQKLDAYAKDTGAHVIYVGQVNRARADGVYPIPGMPDIKDCAELGNGADNVLFVWREQNRETLDPEPEGVIRIGKYRGGQLEVIPTLFDGEHQRWLPREQPKPQPEPVSDHWSDAA